VEFLFFLLNNILLINISFATSIKNSPNSDEVITKKKKKKKKKSEIQKYVIFVNNIYGEFDIFSNLNNLMLITTELFFLIIIYFFSILLYKNFKYKKKFTFFF